MKRIVTTGCLSLMVAGSLGLAQQPDAGQTAHPMLPSGNTQAPINAPPPSAPNAPPDNGAGDFYQALAPYGTWMEIRPFGMVWQPTVAANDPAWRPYCHGGQWIWHNDAYCWHSTYEWGWAPFHYGRWIISSDIGWVWVPGRIWAPAWVCWRQTPTHCGWAPMPPDSSFFAAVNIGSSGASWSFQFTLSDDHYVFVPQQTFVIIRSMPVGALHRPGHGYRPPINHPNFGGQGGWQHPEYHLAGPPSPPPVVQPQAPSRRTSQIRRIVTNVTPTPAPLRANNVRTVAQARPPTPQAPSGNGRSGASSGRRARGVADVISRLSP